MLLAAASLSHGADKRSMESTWLSPSFLAASSKQGVNPPPFGQDWHRSPAAIVKFLSRVDAQKTIDCRKHVARRIRTRDRIHGLVVGRSDHLPDLHAATRKQHGKRARPMIAASLRVDFRRASEFSGDQNHHSPIE